MARYTTLIAAGEMNPNDEFYIENLIYDVADANSYCTCGMDMSWIKCLAYLRRMLLISKEKKQLCLNI